MDLFRDDDTGFIRWVSGHPNGYILNIQRGLNPVDARVHSADCGHIVRAIRAFQAGGRHVAGSYIKVCSSSVEELDDWSFAHVGSSIGRCAHCRAGREIVVEAPGLNASGSGTPASESASPSYELEVRDGEVRLKGPRYLPFERLDPDQLRTRAKLRDALRNLRAGPDEILQAWYSGYRPGNSDVENIVLNNVDSGGACFLPSSAHGVRFEAASGDTHPGSYCAYRYRLVADTALLISWRREAQLVRFTGAELGEFRSEHRLAQTWLAVQNAPAQIAEQPVSPQTRFGIFLEIEAPVSAAAGVRPEHVKSLIDGVVSAFQNHLDDSTVDTVAARIAAGIGAERATVAAKLLRGDRAVLGSRPRLAHLRGEGVQWSPSDHLCVAGQVLRRTSDRWRLSGEIYALAPAAGRGAEPSLGRSNPLLGLPD